MYNQEKAKLGDIILVIIVLLFLMFNPFKVDDGHYYTEQEDMY